MKTQAQSVLRNAGVSSAIVKAGLAVAATFTFALGTAGPSGAQTFVVSPNNYLTIEGNSGTCGVFGAECPVPGDTVRYQQVIDASVFGGQSGVIDGLVLRQDCPGEQLEGEGPAIQVRLSHTLATPAGLSPMFEDNMGSDETMVLDVPLFQLFSEARPIDPDVPCPLELDIFLDIQNRFQYNGQDNLLVDVRVLSDSGPLALDAVSASPMTAAISAQGPEGADSPMADHTDAPAVVAAFMLSPPDQDGDGITDTLDNCTTIFNDDQADENGDGYGDACVPPGSVASSATLGLGPVVGTNTRVRPNAEIGDFAELGNNVRVGRNVTAGDNLIVGDDTRIARNANLGDRVELGPDVWVGRFSNLGDDVMVGEGTVISRNVTIGAGAVIGNNVRIEPGAVIEPGAMIADNAVIRRRATVGEGTEVGANARIGRNANVGAGVTIGDGAVIGRRTTIGDGAGVGDSTSVARDLTVPAGTQIGDNSSIARGVRIGDGVQIGSNVEVERNVRIADNTVVPDDTVLETPRRRFVPRFLPRLFAFLVSFFLGFGF